MSILREVFFDLLFNATAQIALFALLAAAISPLIAKMKAKYQHWFYLAVFVLCVTAPVINTLWSTSAKVLNKSQPLPAQTEKSYNADSWDWSFYSKKQESEFLVSNLKTMLLALWAAAFFYQSIRFGRGIYRVYSLRRNSFPIFGIDVGVSSRGTSPLYDKLPHDVVLLESTDTDDPVTVGVFHPAIIFPSKVVHALDRTDVSAIFAHEYGHIQRKDFLVHVLCQLVALPVAWHPGVQYLLSKSSQTRELACDEYAAVRLGGRTVYARTLLRLATLCLHSPRADAMGLGIFDGDNLEDRIMKLTEKRRSLSRAGLFGLALTTSILFGAGAVLAQAVSLQEAPTSGKTAQSFAGTWHWMFQGHSFATMVLTQDGPEITGSVTGSRIALNDAGELSKADPSEKDAPQPIAKAKLEKDALHVTVMDDNQPFEFTVTLKDATHAEIHPIGAPAKMKPIQAEKVN